MAHECPECGITCHCNGDIDDCVFSTWEAELKCTCCVCSDCGHVEQDCVCECEECGVSPCCCYDDGE